MLTVPALLTLTTLIVFYGFYAIGWLFWHLFRDKNGQVISDSEEVLFSGGPRLVRNVFFLGIAVSQLFTPCMANEHILWPGLNTLVMLGSRIVAFLLCMFYWNHLATLRMKSMEEYLMKRFDSKLIFLLHLLNRICGTYYIWYAYMFIYEKFHLFGVKSLVPFFHLMCAFATLAALGGINVVIVGCVILWVVSTSGDIILLHQTVPHVLKNRTFMSMQPDPCYSLYGPNCFFSIFGQFLTVQPVYNIFQTANSVREANIAMCIGLALAVANTLITMFYTNGLLSYAASEDVEPHNALHAMFGYFYKPAELFLPRFASQSQLEGAYEKVMIPYKHFYILLGPFVSTTIAFFLLQMQAISMHTYLHILPNWLRVGLVTDGRELHLTFTCLFILTCYLTLVLLVYSVHSIGPLSYHPIPHLFQPFLSGVLTPVVTCFVVLGPLCPDVWSVPVVVVTVVVTVAETIFVTQYGMSSQDYCVAYWFPTVIYPLALVANLCMATVLRAPRQATASLLFKYQLSLHRSNGNRRTSSSVGSSIANRFGRPSFRLGSS